MTSNVTPLTTVPSGLPTPAPTLAVPTPEASLLAVIGPALLAAMRDPTTPLQAWFESMRRTDPREFRRWVELALRAAQGGASNGTSQIVNIVNAIPRSHLDELPVGYDVRPN